MLGAIWETFVGNELRKQLRAQGQQESLFFWRDRSREVDFLIHQGGRFQFMEAKWAESITESDTTNLIYVGKTLPPEQITTRLVICRTKAPYQLPNGIEIYPITRPVV